MNFLKKLELQGFKSFALKTVLDFPARVVAIVGPNGSGKSNIIDALRWVLGERGTKELRGEKLDNLIFAGTPKRPAVGLAKVGLYFDNRQREFPLDAEEIMVCRKVDRSGVSEFTCNDSEIRLKDLVPMLARARLGSRGLTMIGQGESDIFTRSTPEERRHMIEEILGLREYRLKKTQAERRLESSSINMEKVKVVLNELAPHLRILRRQRIRFDRRKEIEEALRTIENHYFSFSLHNLKRALTELDQPIKELEEALRGKEKEVETFQKEIHGKKGSEEAERAKKLREKITVLLTHRSQIEKALARLEVKMEMEAARGHDNYSLQELTNVIHAMLNEIDSALKIDDLEKIKNALRNMRELARKIFRERKMEHFEFQEEEKEIKSELDKIDRELGEIRGEEESLFALQERSNREFREMVEALEVKKNEIHSLEQKMQTQFFEKEKIGLRLKELEREWLSLGREVVELETLPPVLETPPADAERKMIRLRGELAAIGEIDENLLKEANESEKRHEFLSRELEDLEKASKDLKDLIENLDRKIHDDFKNAFSSISEAFNTYFRLMFGGGRAKLKIVKPKPAKVSIENQEMEGEVVAEPVVEIEDDAERELKAGVEIELNIPRKKIKSLEMLSGGEKSLVSLAALFALISISPPPFLVLDEIDAPLDESNAKRFADLIQEFSKKTQFVIVTHNRATMEAADVLYGITMGDDGVSKVLSLKLEEAPVVGIN